MYTLQLSSVQCTHYSYLVHTLSPYNTHTHGNRQDVKRLLVLLLTLSDHMQVVRQQLVMLHVALGDLHLQDCLSLTAVVDLHLQDC